MVVGIKNASKLFGVLVITCCAVLVCTMFFNFYFDIAAIKDKITSETAMNFYHAQLSTAKVVCLVCGGCLLLTSVVMLLFYIRNHIDAHKKELGILKALGYSSMKIAANFWTFGSSAFIGCSVGYGCAFLIMPKFYALQNSDNILPEISISFHPIIFVYLVLLPAAAFALLSVFFAYRSLKKPVLHLLRDDTKSRRQKLRAKKEKPDGLPFVEYLKSNTLRSKKALAFFMFFASFCFSAMTQMSFSMKDLSSAMMAAMVLIIGLVLAFTTLYIAVATVVRGNSRTIAMMRAMGYRQTECCRAILGCYRPVSYVGFAVGTVYQYALLRLMVDIVFRDVAGIPTYKFDFVAMLFSLAAFAVLYETLMYVFSQRIKRINIKEIMV